MNSNGKNDLEWAARVRELVSLAHVGYEDAIGSEISRYESEKLNIAVVGLMKRGKSTFCNAFLNRGDDDLAPIGRLPATGIISKYCSHPTRRDADVRFVNGEMQTIDYADIRKFVTEEHNPENKKNVQLVTVYGDFGFGDDVELMDMPGDNSIHAYHTEIVYRYLPQADVIVFLSSAQDPIQKDELGLLKKVNRDLNNIFFVINKVDKCDEDELNEAEEQDRKVLENAGIKVRKLYRISAKDVLEGRPCGGYTSLLQDIRQFLKLNKVDLLRGVFVKRVLENAAPAVSMLEAGTELKKLELSDLAKALEDLNKAAAAMKEQAARVSSSFGERWKQMVSEFSNALPTVEEKVKASIVESINNIPALSINSKTLDKIPELISSTIEAELSKPTQFFEQQVRDEISKVSADFPSISKYLADENYRITLQQQLGYGTGSSFFGGVLLSGNLIVGSFVSSLLTGLSGLTLGPLAVGKGIAGIMGTLALPLTALTVVGAVGGALLMAMPVFGWIRGKNKQKREILDSAMSSIENAFRSMRLRKIPELGRKADDFIRDLNARLDKELEAVKHQLDEAVQKRQHLQEEIGDESFKQDECRLAALRDLLQEGRDAIASLSGGRMELVAYEQ